MNKILLSFFMVLASSLCNAWDNNDIDTAWRKADIAALSLAIKEDGFTGLYAHYRLAVVALEINDKKTAKKSLDAIKNALKKNYKTPDEAALYSASLGQSIALKPWQAAFIAGPAEDALAYSFELTKEHAPTYMVKGIALFNTPSFIGGDKQAALDMFNTAIALYSQTESWGLEDAWLWKIKTLQALEQFDQAKSTRDLLLEMFPDYRSAQQMVL